MPPVSIEGKPFASIKMLDDIVDQIGAKLNTVVATDNDNKYVVFAVKDIAWISLSIISATSRMLHWRYNAYTAATMTRLLIECVTEIKYIKTHPKKAKKFWSSQEAIKETINKEKTMEQKWKVFTSGQLNKFGQLSDNLTTRIKNMLGEDVLGIYNMLCFYSHPNIAGYMWVSHDTSQPGAIVHLAAETFFRMIDKLLTELESLESNNLKVDNLLADVKRAYQQYNKECENQ